MTGIFQEAVEKAHANSALYRFSSLTCHVQLLRRVTVQLGHLRGHVRGVVPANVKGVGEQNKAIKAPASRPTHVKYDTYIGCTQ